MGPVVDLVAEKAGVLWRVILRGLSLVDPTEEQAEDSIDHNYVKLLVHVPRPICPLFELDPVPLLTTNCSPPAERSATLK